MKSDTKYRMTFRCMDCAHVFKRVTSNMDLDPKCPECKKAKSINTPKFGDGAFDPNADTSSFAGQRTPNLYSSKDNTQFTGDRDTVQRRIKAFDTAQEMVAKDYSMTDLKTDVRPGESMAPNLPPAMQAQADSFFAPKKNSLIPKQLQSAGARAMAGSYRDKHMPTVEKLNMAPKPAVKTIYEYDDRK